MTLNRFVLSGVAAGALGIAAWLYASYIRITSAELATGVYAVFGGGGNSLVVRDGSEVLLVDPKFPPGAQLLAQWVAHAVGGPVTAIVNSHYHYDHTFGNVLYSDRPVYAHGATLSAMRAQNGSWWRHFAGSLPNRIVDGSRLELPVGSQVVELHHPGPAHTHGDLSVYLAGFDVVATGDLVFHGYYPFIDDTSTGADLTGWASAVRSLAKTHAHAIFVPGHGPLATATDLHHFADYLEELETQVQRAYRSGLSEDEAVVRTKVSARQFGSLPVFAPPGVVWTTRSNNVRWAYRLLATRGTG
jgi:glyoxylase-like metal-dependent hydrolase (beta-lactamase superfamily II)